MMSIWLHGLVRRRGGRLLATAAGVAIAVALMASLGAFFASSKATMTNRAAQGVAVDWQVAVKTAPKVAPVLRAVKAAPGTIAALPVTFADTQGMHATAGGTTQSTGPGEVLGIPAGYWNTFPKASRLLSGSRNGVLLAQQTAANLHVKPGDTIVIGRSGSRPFHAAVAGVIDLPQSDSLFQRVGAPSQSQPVAPPDNVALLPASVFAKAYAPGRIAPGVLTTQIHVKRSHALPPDPSAAFTADMAAALHLQAVTSGAGVVGDNLGATLDAARSDALYAQILFLFLGAPGALLAAALTAAVSSAGATRRRTEQALLRTRGATRAQLLRLSVIEAVLVGAIGSIVGLLAATGLGALIFGSPSLGATPGAAIAYAGTSVLVGILISVLVIVFPAFRDLRDGSRITTTGDIGRAASPRWLRYGLDFIFLGAALAVFWATSRNQFNLVLVPEGVPTISVNYWAFLGPALAWAGAALLAWRIADLLLNRGSGLVSGFLKPVAHELARTVASQMSRQRRTIARSAVLVGLALSFAISTATFNSTYRQQAEADAQLTNGADVTVTESPGTSVPPARAAALARVPGVKAVQPVQHRFAYVGTDLQDLYGISPRTITKATTLQDAYFQNATAAQSLQRLASGPNGVLVSAETVNSFQLHLGDTLRLRLQVTDSHSYRYVTFRYVGIVNEFPTAPKDSFLVTNASYVAQQTGSNAVGAFLVNTGGQNISSIGNQIQNLVGTSAKVTGLTATRGQVSSSLTSVDLTGLTKLELIFALIIVAAAGGLVTGLALNERRKSLAIATALGANSRQLRTFGLGEPTFVAILGVVTGALAGWGLSEMLVKVLTGVFDPPPAHLAVPWNYLSIVTVASLLAIALAAVFIARRAETNVHEQLREL